MYKHNQGFENHKMKLLPIHVIYRLYRHHLSVLSDDPDD
jgi:hypothetical protein